jgi:hypothetical protein
MQPKTFTAKAIYPLDGSHLVILLDEPVAVIPTVKLTSTSQAGLLDIKSVQVDSDNPTRVVLETTLMGIDGIVVDSLHIQNGLASRNSGERIEIVTPKFVHGIKDATELKALQLESTFPYSSRLVGVHVSVSCCTGCNGGVHDRNLVVLNHHIGGPWTGIWVQTAKTIEAPYPRWQKILCAGGVVSDLKGSVTVVDEGWMEIHKRFEEPHHAPPPLPITCAQMPNKELKNLIAKGLDASWVEFTNIVVESAEIISPIAEEAQGIRLPRNQIVFSDSSGSSSTAFLYQPTGLKVEKGVKLAKLRGFIHAEAVGQYVLLSDKEEDIILEHCQ